MTTPANQPDPPITVRKIAYQVPVEVLGTDEQGRTLVRCPSRGCGEPAYIAEDGHVVCTVGEAYSAFLSDAMDKLLDGYREGWRP